MTLLPKVFPSVFLATIAFFAAHAQEMESTIAVAGKTNGEKWWNGNCERIRNDLKLAGDSIDIGFIGDSITARWRGSDNWQKHWGSYKAVNMGIGGDRTQNVLWRLQNGELEGYKAKAFVVMIGTNNLWAKEAKPDEAAAGVKAILDLVQAKQPQAKILLISLLPVGEKPGPGRDSRAAVNDIIKTYAGGSIAYVDIAEKYLQPDGTISKEVMHDFLHLAPKGYDIWAEAITPKIKEILGAK
ncbi:MAG: hypothetical protein RI957_898 [Verrucomicrobiota bacterium]|jgi:lysophospholipase L1-like esterase